MLLRRPGLLLYMTLVVSMSGAMAPTAAGQSAQERDAVSNLQKGRTAYQRGDYGAALAAFDAAAKMAPSLAQSQYFRGMALEKLTRSPEAEKAYAAALRLDPKFAEAHVNLGAMATASGQWSKAADHFRDAVRIKPDYFLAHLNLGAVLEKQGAAKEALRAYKSAIRAEPADVRGHRSFCALLKKNGRSDLALAHLQRAVAQTPSGEQVWTLFGHFLLDAGRVPQARKAFEKAVRVGNGPAYGPAWAGLGNAALAAHDPVAALQALIHALGLLPDSASIAEDHCRAAVAVAASKRGKGAREGAAACRAALVKNPNAPRVHYGLVKALVMTGDCKGAATQVSALSGLPGVKEQAILTAQNWVSRCAPASDRDGARVDTKPR